MRVFHADIDKSFVNHGSFLCFYNNLDKRSILSTLFCLFLGENANFDYFGFKLVRESEL
jgi:hypothetical protein